MLATTRTALLPLVSFGDTTTNGNNLTCLPIAQESQGKQLCCCCNRDFHEKLFLLLSKIVKISCENTIIQ
jgi:hypothetical protein